MTPLNEHSDSPELLLGSHEGDLVPDGLDEVVVSGDGARHHRELPPVVPHEDGEHGGHLVLQARRQLQLQPLLGLKTQSQFVRRVWSAGPIQNSEQNTCEMDVPSCNVDFVTFHACGGRFFSIREGQSGGKRGIFVAT